MVLDALAGCGDRFDLIVSRGGEPGGDQPDGGDLVNLKLARAGGLPSDGGRRHRPGRGLRLPVRDRGAASRDLRATVRGFVINRLRGDPALLGDACADLERRCGVPTLGVLPHLGVVDIDNEDSLALDRPPAPIPGEGGDTVEVAALCWPRVSNAGNLDPLRLEPGVQVRWVRSVVELGRPDLVVLPGSKNARGDLDWFRRTGLAAAVERSEATVVLVSAGLQMAGRAIEDPDGVEGPEGV